MRRSWVRFGLCGAAAGLANGLFGAGGGMVLVPLLTKFGKLESKQAFSSAIAIILPLCLITVYIYWTHQIFPLQTSFPFLLGGLAGGILGGLLFRKITPQFLHRLFGLVILWGGLRLLWS